MTCVFVSRAERLWIVADQREYYDNVRKSGIMFHDRAARMLKAYVSSQ